MYNRRIDNPSEVVRLAQQWHDMGEDRTFVICGKPGPTGKTWLWNELRKAGHNAIEISDGLGGLVDFRDDNNYLRDIGFRTAVVILNKPVLRPHKGYEHCYI